MGDTSPAPRSAYVQPHERAASKSAKTGKVQGPLQDISNIKMPTTDAVANKGKTKSKLLKQVSSQWRKGNGRPQTSTCLAAIRICLDAGIHPDDIAEYVTDGFEIDVKAKELKRARDSAKRISKKSAESATSKGIPTR